MNGRLDDLAFYGDDATLTLTTSESPYKLLITKRISFKLKKQMLVGRFSRLYVYLYSYTL